MNHPTAAQPIDLNKVEKYIAESKADGLKATAIRNDDLEVLIALARQQPAASGAGEVAAREGAVINYGSLRESCFPELPEPCHELQNIAQSDAYTAEQMFEYGALCVQLAAAPAAPHAPAGWKLVPVEPTDAMCMAAREKLSVSSNYADHIYRAMLAAAPAAPHAQAEPVRYEYRVNACGSPTHWRGTSKERYEEMKKSPQVEYEGEGVAYEVRALCVAPVPQEAEQARECQYPHETAKCIGCGWEAEQAAPAAVTDGLIEYRYTGGTHWCELGPGEHMKANFDGVYRLKAGAFPVWQGETQSAAPAVTDAARDVLADAKGDEA